VVEPFPVYSVNGRYLLFDVNGTLSASPTSCFSQPCWLLAEGTKGKSVCARIESYHSAVLTAHLPSRELLPQGRVD